MFFKEHFIEVFNVEPQVLVVRQGMYSRCLREISKRQAICKATKSNNLKFLYKFVEEIEDNVQIVKQVRNMINEDHTLNSKTKQDHLI